MSHDVDPAILNAREIFKASGKSLDELGCAMGAKGEVARKSAWQFLNKVNDPKLGTLRRFAAAMGVPVEELVKVPAKDQPASRKRKPTG